MKIDIRRYPFPRSPRSSSSLVWVVILLTAVLALFARAAEPGARSVRPAASQMAQVDSVRVERVVDGDTLKLVGGERVRLIGIDTPELHESAKLYRDAERTGQDIKTIQRMGGEAASFTRELVDGKNVRLEYDVQPRDRYGRLLAYVYLEDGTFVNAQIIRRGYAYPLTVPPNTRHAAEFRRLFEEARRSRAGLWASGPYLGEGHEPSR
ncbi:MAG: thermonuclease [Candidatus Omnitrophica bacterium]|nr:thermonuclease [Candidatus Omnitrophota bacterium]